MKTGIKVIGAIMGLGVVILTGLHIFLQYGLTRALQEVILPRIKAESGIDARVGRLSINIPAGVLYLRDVEVKNPEGFLLENAASVDYVRVELDTLSLLKKNPVLIRNIEVEHALLNVVRNREGQVNLEVLAPARSDKTADTAPAPEKPVKQRALPEMLIQGLSCDVVVRYIDLRLDQYDVALDLHLSGGGLSTQRDASLPWGRFALIGSLGDDRASFITDLQLSLAPIPDPAAPSFDLTGKMMEIDPRLLEQAYDKLGIRSAPFSLEPAVYCREGVLTNSTVALNIRNIRLEEKLAGELGGMASIDALRFSVAVTGTLRSPALDLEQAIRTALGGNAQSLIEALLKGAAASEAGLDREPTDAADAAVELLGAHVEEIGGSEAVKTVLKELIDGTPSTNAAGLLNSDLLIDVLGEQVDEVGEHEEVKDELKNIGKWLFGK